MLWGLNEGLTFTRHDNCLWRLTYSNTWGAFGALAFGIGTSEVEHVLATQTAKKQSRAKTLKIEVQGKNSQWHHGKRYRIGDYRKRIG